VTLNVGFLTVLPDATGYVGAYFVTNNWGRPLEFWVSSAVQPNRVQQILYADTLKGYLCGDLIGKTLFDKSKTPVQFVVTDTEAALDLRLKLEIPVLWLVNGDDERAASLSSAANCARPAKGKVGALLCHPQCLGDLGTLAETLEAVTGVMNVGEPFVRIREAIGEARKAGSRAAA